MQTQHSQTSQTQASAEAALFGPREAELNLLHALKKNVEMGKQALDHILKKTGQEEFRALLLRHYESFEHMAVRLTERLTELGETPKNTGFWSEFMLKNGINMNTFMDDSLSRLAELLIKGNNMGVTDINRELNHCPDGLDPKTKKRAEEIVALEQEQINELKRYL